MSNEPDVSPARPNIKRMWLPFPLIWLVPLAAAIGAGFYFREAMVERGTLITIEFVDANGLKKDDSRIMHRGAELGNVESIELSDDARHARVRVRLQEKYSAFAKKGAQFWIVKADLGSGGITGLSTIVSGPYIEARPGTGEASGEFIGLDKEPIAFGDGIHLFLHATRLEHLEVDAPVKYKGILVGAVQGIRLSDDASRVDVEVFIRREYAFLVRTTSEFWTESPADVKGGLFSGIDVKLGSLRSLISGSVSFATSDEVNGEVAPDGAQFTLHSEPKKEWQSWSPHLQRPAPTTETDSGEVTTQAPQVPSMGRK